MPSIVLYYFAPSGPCRGALMTARMLNIDVEIKNVNLFLKEQLKEEFLEINPQHCVPTIDDGGFYLWDSHAISTYLIGKYGQTSSLYSQEVEERAKIDQRLYFNATVLYPRIRAVCIPFIYGNATSISDDLKESMKEALKFLDTFLTGKSWLVGERLTVADIILSATVANAEAIGYNIPQHPSLSVWFEQCKSTIKGFDENLKGAAEFGALVRAKHPSPLFN